MRLLHMIVTLLRMTFCDPQWAPGQRLPGDHGIIVKKECMRCKAVTHEYVSRRKGA